MKLEELKNLWIVNWIWSGKLNFSLLYSKILKDKNILSDEIEKLKIDIEDLSVYHDIVRYNWNTWLEKITSDYTFALWVIGLLQQARIRTRIFVFILIMLALNTIWNRYYNFWEKKFISLEK